MYKEYKTWHARTRNNGRVDGYHHNLWDYVECGRREYSGIFLLLLNGFLNGERYKISTSYVCAGCRVVWHCYMCGIYKIHFYVIMEFKSRI